jgi:hypothetical protein
LRIPETLPVEYSVSRRLAEHRDDHYAELAAASRGGLDITRWLTWFVEQFEEACRSSEAVIDRSFAMARFWLDAMAPGRSRVRVPEACLAPDPRDFVGFTTRRDKPFPFVRDCTSGVFARAVLST